MLSCLPSPSELQDYVEVIVLTIPTIFVLAMFVGGIWSALVVDQDAEKRVAQTRERIAYLKESLGEK